MNHKIEEVVNSSRGIFDPLATPTRSPLLSPSASTAMLLFALSLSHLLVRRVLHVIL
jgi:hypothetical protein